MNASDFSFLFFWFEVKMPCLLRTQWSSLPVVPCVESNQSERSNQRLPYLQDLSTLNSQELIMVGEDGQIRADTSANLDRNSLAHAYKKIHSIYHTKATILMQFSSHLLLTNEPSLPYSRAYDNPSS